MNHNIYNACVRGKPVHLPDSQDLVNYVPQGYQRAYMYEIYVTCNSAKKKSFYIS